VSGRRPHRQRARITLGWVGVQVALLLLSACAGASSGTAASGSGSSSGTTVLLYTSYSHRRWMRWSVPTERPIRRRRSTSSGLHGAVERARRGEKRGGRCGGTSSCCPIRCRCSSTRRRGCSAAGPLQRRPSSRPGALGHVLGCGVPRRRRRQPAGLDSAELAGPHGSALPRRRRPARPRLRRFRVRGARLLRASPGYGMDYYKRLKSNGAVQVQSPTEVITGVGRSASRPA
jgi:hypothetical protein